MLFIFDAGQLSADQLAGINYPDGEIAEYAFVEPGGLDQFTIPRLTRRLQATLQVLTDHQLAYLENGATPPQTPTLDV